MHEVMHVLVLLMNRSFPDILEMCVKERYLIISSTAKDLFWGDTNGSENKNRIQQSCSEYFLS